MNLYYFFQKYLDNLNDTVFKIKWEKFVLQHMKRFISIIAISWLILSVALGYVFSAVIGQLLGFLLMIVFSIYFGYLLFVQTLKFLAINNSRYIDKMMNEDESVINYDNVVG